MGERSSKKNDGRLDFGLRMLSGRLGDQRLNLNVFSKLTHLLARLQGSSIYRLPRPYCAMTAGIYGIRSGRNASHYG